jgi:hypothetical protein
MYMINFAIIMKVEKFYKLNLLKSGAFLEFFESGKQVVRKLMFLRPKNDFRYILSAVLEKPFLQVPFKEMVVGSIPTGRTNYKGRSIANAPAPEKRRERRIARLKM